MDQETPSNSLFDLQLDHQTSGYLGEAARWARFLAVVGLIVCGLMSLGGLFVMLSGSNSVSNMDGRFSTYGGRMQGLFVFLFALLLFFPCLYLFRFGSKMRTALAGNDQSALTESLRNLKSHLKFNGIFAIIFLGFYALAVAGLVIGSLMGR
jgi:hypothetical protein